MIRKLLLGIFSLAVICVLIIYLLFSTAVLIDSWTDDVSVFDRVFTRENLEETLILFGISVFIFFAISTVKK